MESKEAQLYRMINSAITRAATGHKPSEFSVDVPLDDILKDGETDPDSPFLRVSINMEWVSFEDVYFEDIIEELEKEEDYES